MSTNESQDNFEDLRPDYYTDDMRVLAVQEKTNFDTKDFEQIPGYRVNGAYLWCSHCERRRAMEETGSYEQGFSRAGPPVRYSLLRCSRCHTPVLAAQEWEGLWTEPRALFPSIGRPLDYGLIPPEVSRPFREAERCLHDADAYQASIALCRKVIEATCYSLKTGGANLAAQIRKLEEMGHIEGRLVAWANQLRLEGNAAVHSHDAVADKQTAHDVLEFTYSLINHVFVLSWRFDEFMNRREEHK